MFNIFKKSPIIDKSTRSWLLDTYEWAMRNCGSDTFAEDVVLILPTPEYFPDKVNDKKQLVRYVFDTMRKFAGLSDWPIEIVEKSSNPDPVVAETMVISGSPHEAPMDIIYPKSEDDPMFIEYSLELAENTERLVAAFAYDLSRIYCSYMSEEPPGGEEFLGHTVELTAVFLGFGIILANSSFQFQQYTSVGSQGWSSSNVGFLSQYELTYALAIFCELKSVDKSLVFKGLKKSLKPYLNLARNELDADPKILWRLKNMSTPVK